MYKILSSSNIQTLEKQARQMMQDGWIPSGGLCSCTKKSAGDLRITHQLYQVMIKTGPTIVTKLGNLDDKPG